MNYTSIEQSKKLVNLGINKYTCDLVYKKKKYRDDYDIIIPMTNNGLLHNLNYFGERPNDIPCWSLAALLGILPKSLIYTPNPTLDGYCCKNIMHDLETYSDNPVDACYEMIIHLHELNLL